MILPFTCEQRKAILEALEIDDETAIEVVLSMFPDATRDDAVDTIECIDPRQ